MSSTDKTKFKITETSKQANVDITSNTVELPADSADHTLVAKVPSAANCTSGVTVEVEMSPDGENWCAAQRKTISAGQTTQEVIGNQFATQLDPNTTNKHARGVMNRDLTTDQAYQGSEQNEAIRTDAADFMHHKMGVDKSFNYSQWFKTSENPTTTYKPVLFRHGGYDNFENTKTVELTAGPSSNNTKYLPTTTGGTPAPGLYYQTTFTNNKGWFPTYDDSTRTGGTAHWWTETDSAISFWHKGNNSQSASQVIMYQYFHDHGAPFGSDDTWEGKFLIYFKSGYLYIERANNDYYRSGSWSVGYKWFSVSSVSSTDWHHYVINIPQNASLMTAISNATVTIDGGATSHGTTGTNTGGYDPDSAALTITHAGVLSTPSNVSTYPGNWTGTSTYTADIDELSTWRKNLTSTEISEIYNSGSYLDVTTSSCSSYLERHIRFGDHTNDGTSLYDAVSDTSFLDSHNSTDLTASLSNSDSIAEAKTTQNLCEPGVAWNAAGVSVTDTGYLQTTSASTLTYDDAFSISFWVKFDSVISSANAGRDDFFVGFTYGSGRVNVGGSPTHYRDDSLMIQFRGTNGTNFVSFGGAYAALTLPTQIDDGNWHNVIIVKEATTHGSSGVPVTDFGIGAAAKLNVYIDGSVATPGAPSGGPGPAGTTAFNDYKMGGFVHDASSGGNILAAQAFKTDEVVLWKGHALTSAERTTVVNSGVPNDLDAELSNVPSNYYRFENTSDLTVDTKSNTALTVSNASTLSLTSESIYAEENAFLNLFRTNVNFSISGWFKTTDTGTLFSNTGGAAATGMKMEVNASDMTLSFLDISDSISINSAVNDGEWHHIVITKTMAQQFTTFIDGVQVDQTTKGSITNDDLRGGNGFTLLGDGQNNAKATSPSSTDASKLNATLSNWSLHLAILLPIAVKQMYSNGHVRNIKNLPSVPSSDIEAWWQLNDQTTPEQDTNDPVNGFDLQYQDGNSPTKTLVDPTILVDATGETLVEDSINGNALTLSLTKSFNFTTNTWVATADQDTALCLSLNGFEEQAEYFALWKCSQPNLPTDSPTETIDICDGDWHNVILSYRGLEDFVGDTVQEGDIVKFGNNNSNDAFHWTISYDGYPLSGINNEIGADYIGGLNTVEAGNVGFAIYNRHLKFQTSNNEEVYKPHTQFSSGELGTTSSNYYKYGFEGYVDETSFHSDTWWVNQDASLITPSSFDQEKPYTIFGRTTALNNRGSGTGYPQGVPYPLSQPDLIEASRGTNQWINPYPIGVTQEDNNVSIGGLEAWYRWGDTAGDCSINVFDVRSSTESLSATETRSLKVEGVTDVDVFALTSSDSIYLEDEAATVGGGISYVNFTILDLATAIGTATCTVKDFGTSILQYLRIKLTGSGTCDIGEGKLEIEVNHKKRRMK